MAKKVVLKDSSGNKCYPLTRDECILSGDKTLPERISELVISNNITFNSIINSIKVYGNVSEKSKIELSFFSDKGSQLWVDGVSKGVYVYNEWSINNIIEHTYNDVTIKFVPKAEPKETGKAILNNQIVLETLKTGDETLKTDDETLKTDNELFNNIVKYIKVYGNVSENSEIKMRLYQNGGSDLTVDGILKGAYTFGGSWVVGAKLVCTYTDVSVVIVPKEELVNTDYAVLNNQIVVDTLSDISISRNEIFNSYFAYFEVYGNVNYSDKIEFALYSNKGSGLYINGAQKGAYVYSDWEVGKELTHTYSDVSVLFRPIKDAYSSGKVELNNKVVLFGVHRDIKKQIEDLNTDIGELINTINSSKLKFACFGDSITSNQVSNIGGLIKQKLGINFLQQTEEDVEGAGNVTTEFGNLAVGWSTMTDVYLTDGGENQTPIYLLKSANVNPNANPYNVLSNQIRRLIAHTTELGQQISWMVQSDSSTTTIPTEFGTGKGYTDDKPDIIYIASGINDGTSVGNWDLILKENFDEVISQNYADLKRDTMYSALRWVIETLQNVYPRAIIFIATPLYSTFNSNERLTKKCEIIRKMCEYMRVKVIDSNLKSGINPKNADTVYGGLHPNADGKEIVSSFVVGQIRGNCNIL